MADQFYAEIRIFPFNFPPKNWAFCDGQIMPLSQNTALFALLGTTYGGNGTTTFALPDLQGSAAIHVGGNQPGPGLSQYALGQVGGSSAVTLLTTEMPAHTHTAATINNPGNLNAPSPNTGLARSSGGFGYKAPGGSATTMAPEAITPTGSSFPHNNMMPFLALNFCIALQGIFPARNSRAPVSTPRIR